MANVTEASRRDERTSTDPRSFGRRNLDELLRVDPGPAVSIYLPRAGSAPSPNRDRLRLRAALDRAEDLLPDGASGPSDTKVLDPLRPLVENPALWQHVAGSIAIFRAAELLRVYRLPAKVPELVVVGSTFHTRPLMNYLQSPDRFWILELSQGAVGLWRGDATEACRVDPSPLPADMRSVLGYEYSRDSELIRRSCSGGVRVGSVRPAAGGSVGTFSAHGVGDDDRVPALRRFFGVVDRALRDYLGRESGPIILAAVAEHHALYKSITRIGSLTPVGIEASIHGWNPKRVHDEAWPLALEAGDVQIASALESWDRAYGRGKGEMDPATLGHLAVTGRIHTLLTESGRRLWGTIDRETGELNVEQMGGEHPGRNAVEILGELSELVMLHGGSTLVVPAERMPTTTGAAGILR